LKVLVIGSGGREHALVWKISQSPLVSKVYCLPGNAGIAQLAECVLGDPLDVVQVAAWANRHQIDLTVVGPELPLTLGITDEFSTRGLAIFGASKAAARIEGSKVYCKELLHKYHIPTAAYRIFSDPASAMDYVSQLSGPTVVKADGLAAGKGVIVCQDQSAARQAVKLIMEDRAFGAAGTQVVIEDCLVGEEVSFLAFTDGQTVLPMISSQDHKAVYDGDQGPNTGGMGAYSPTPLITSQMADRIMDEVMLPAVKGLAQEGHPYKGVLYAGLMIVDGNPYVLEFNARFGDPETQAILPLMDSDIVPIMQAVVNNRLNEVTLDWKPGAAVCITLASGGYPGNYHKGRIIHGLDAAQAEDDILLFHAGTDYKEGSWITNGGRVLGVVGCGPDIPAAIKRSYEGVSNINFEQMHYRTDIGKKALKYMD
jgi:phosphoribosylamine--glycine ligase